MHMMKATWFLGSLSHFIKSIVRAIAVPSWNWGLSKCFDGSHKDFEISYLKILFWNDIYRHSWSTSVSMAVGTNHQFSHTACVVEQQPS